MMKSCGVSLGLALILVQPAFCQQRKTDRERDGFLGPVYAVRQSLTFPTQQAEAPPPPERHTTSYYDKNGDLILQLDYVGGRMITRKTFRHNGPGEVNEKIEDGGVDSTAGVAGPNPPARVMKHSLKFDATGNVIEESLYLEDGTRLETTEYRRDPQGRVLEKQVKSLRGGSLPGRNTFAYGEGNEPTSSTYEPLRGQPATVTYRYQYDSMNNWIKKQAGGSGPLVERTITYYSPESSEGVRIPGESPADSLQPAPLSDLPKVIRKSGGILQGSAIRKVEPFYPMSARAAHITGQVQVEVRIDHSGAVVEARALSGPRELQDAAVQAAKQWRFPPTKLAGVLVDVIGTIAFNFLM